MFKNHLDVELSAISEHLPRLEQLSIMGTRNVTTRAVIAMAQTLTSLKLLDVGYCEQVDLASLKDLNAQIRNWILQTCAIEGPLKYFRPGVNFMRSEFGVNLP